jgi:TrmH family RNA methyltransferase
MPLSKNTIKWIHALRQKKYRQKYNKFIVEGDKMAMEILRQRRWEVDRIYALASWVRTNASVLTLYQERLNVITEAELKKISTLKTPNQVLAVVTIDEEFLSTEQWSAGKSLYLDGIQDPGNMGTILRIADWFGLTAVFCSEDCADLYNPKVVQSSMGAFLRAPVRRIELARLLEQAPGLPVIGAVLEGKNAFGSKLPECGLLVIGSEGKGISPANEALLTHRLTIPGGGGAESLNAGVACGILCAWWANG